jgi:hypothetical protein
MDTKVSCESFRETNFLELLYEVLNGLMDTKVYWEFFKDKQVSLQCSQRPYEALHNFVDAKISSELFKDKKFPCKAPKDLTRY